MGRRIAPASRTWRADQPIGRGGARPDRGRDGGSGATPDAPVATAVATVGGACSAGSEARASTGAGGPDARRSQGMLRSAGDTLSQHPGIGPLRSASPGRAAIRGQHGACMTQQPEPNISAVSGNARARTSMKAPKQRAWRDAEAIMRRAGYPSCGRGVIYDRRVVSTNSRHLCTIRPSQLLCTLGSQGIRFMGRNATRNRSSRRRQPPRRRSQSVFHPPHQEGTR